MNPPELPNQQKDAAYDQDKAAVEQITKAQQGILQELRKAVIGQEEPMEQLLIALLSGGHCLLTGAPGLAKTLMVQSIAQVFHLEFNRIQFTPDLMPADITGTEILQETEEGRKMRFVKGPVFANMLLADEINRTPPKTQAALLEAMQEKQVTAAGVTYDLDQPFFVLATQNPIEMDGTYPLPEAQLDRFMFNVIIDYLNEDDEVKVVTKTTGIDVYDLKTLFTGEELLNMHRVVRKVEVEPDVARYAVKLAVASRPGQPDSLDFVNEWVSWGAGLRGGQNLVLGGKARALLNGRPYVKKEDIKALAAPVMRHRILTNYRAEAENVTVEDVIGKLLESVS